MTEEQQAPDQDATAEEDPRKQLWVRASVAGGLIGLLLGAAGARRDCVADQAYRAGPGRAGNRAGCAARGGPCR